MNKNSKTGVSSLLTLGALGVVFGDIGTSPLYTVQTAFSITGHKMSINSTNVLGLVSFIIWALLISVTIKFIGFILRANNHGEGGILALVSLIRNRQINKKYTAPFIALGVIGVCLFYGDCIITPAISVMSAVEGIKVVNANLEYLILPITLIILVGLFWIQHYGTGAIGRLFGPLMLVWFVAIGGGGLAQILHDPHVLFALSPLSGYAFINADPVLAFLSLTVVVLAVTGAEALYADLGHFGRGSIARAWLLIVLPALLLSYIGQGAYLLTHPSAANISLVALYPHTLQTPFVILATIATLIASESVIAGAFSLTRQAIQLNLLPKMRVSYTALTSGRVYLPAINFLLFIGVTALVVIFGSADKLANAYGVAVSGVVLIDAVLFLALSTHSIKTKLIRMTIFIFLVIPVDILMFSANLTKIIHGGIYPLAVAGIVYCMVTTWSTGEAILTSERQRIEGSLDNFVQQIHLARSIKRVPGAAVFLGHHAGFAPLALHATVEKMHELPEITVILTVEHTNDAHVPSHLRAKYDELLYANDGISNLRLSYGFHDAIDIPKALKEAGSKSAELQFDLSNVAYVISSAQIVITKRHHMANWRKHLYVTMARNTSARDYFKLPTRQVEEVDTILEL